MAQCTDRAHTVVQLDTFSRLLDRNKHRMRSNLVKGIICLNAAWRGAAFVMKMNMSKTTGMPPLELTAKRHTSDFSARKNHPTSYEQSPRFVGPLVLPRTLSTSDNRIRIKNYYMDESNELIMPNTPLRPLRPSASTDVIIKTIIENFAYHDAPVDAKELAESVEFYLRCRKRLLGAGKKRHAKYCREDKKAKEKMKTTTSCGPSHTDDEDDPNNNDDALKKANIEVYDLCSGHGLTGMFFAACNPPTEKRIVKTICVDMVEPPSHAVLRDLIAEVCPWVNDQQTIRFDTHDLNSYVLGGGRGGGEEGVLQQLVGGVEQRKICPIVIATHACGTLTDLVLKKAISMEACAIAAMPCCYTGTDRGAPYGIKRAMGVAWAADIKRTFLLEEHNYHTDFSTIPLEITPLNRIIVAEDRS